jgi:hypothetical protein
MLRYIEEYKRVLFVGSFISIVSLVAIVANKYVFFNKQDFALTIALCSLFVFAIVLPLLSYFFAKMNMKSFVVGVLFLIMLFFELMIWVLLFHGCNGLPPVDKLHFFAYPFILFAFAFVICLFLPVRKGKDVSDG